MFWLLLGPRTVDIEYATEGFARQANVTLYTIIDVITRHLSMRTNYGEISKQAESRKPDLPIENSTFTADHDDGSQKTGCRQCSLR